MGKSWKLGGTYKYNGDKVVVSAINDDGTLVLNYAAGSGKTGFAGKVAGGATVKQPIALLPEGFLVDGNDVEEATSLEAYNNYQEIDLDEYAEAIETAGNKYADSLNKLATESQASFDAYTEKMAGHHNLTVDEYELWLDNPERTKENTWVDLEFDEDDNIRKARIVSVLGNLVTMSSEDETTIFTRYIGQKIINSKIVDKKFAESDITGLEDFINKEVDN